MFYNNLHIQKAADYISALQGKPHSYRILYRHSNGFAIKNTVEIYGNGDFTITSYATGAIMIKYPTYIHENPICWYYDELYAEE